MVTFFEIFSTKNMTGAARQAHAAVLAKSAWRGPKSVQTPWATYLRNFLRTAEKVQFSHFGVAELHRTRKTAHCRGRCLLSGYSACPPDGAGPGEGLLAEVKSLENRKFQFFTKSAQEIPKSENAPSNAG